MINWFYFLYVYLNVVKILLILINIFLSFFADFLYFFRILMAMDEKIYEQLKADFKKDSKEKKTPLSVYIILLVILLIPLVVFLVNRKPYSFVTTFDNLPEPVEVPFSGSTDFTALWKNFQVEFLSTYDINWKVIAVKHFNWISNFSNKLSPKDFVLWWWIMWVQENIDKFVRSDDLVNLMMFADLKSWNEERFLNHWGEKALESKYSNNRLIPSDKKVRILLNRIEEWDEIRIKWYLSRISLDDGSWQWWPSCIEKSNNDNWCDIIFVTDVSRLKEI